MSKVVRAVIALLALPAVALAQQTSAVRTIADCDARARAQPRSLDSYRCFTAIVHHDGDFGAARQHLEALVRLDAANPRPLLILGIIDADQGLSTAPARFERAAVLARAGSDRDTEVAARILLSISLIGRQRLDDADREMDKAAEVVLPSTPTLAAAVDLQRANVALARHDFAKSTILLKAAEPHIFPAGPVDLRTRWLSTMASNSWSLGRTEESYRLYTQQVDLLAASGNLYAEAGARTNLVLLAGNMNRPRDERLGLAKAARAAAAASRNTWAEGTACFYLAELSSGREAMDYAGRALTIARARRDPESIMLGLRATAATTLEFDRTGAFRLIDEAIDLARSRGDLANLARNRVVRSRMTWKIGRGAQAIEDSIAALDAIESERDIQPDTLVRAQRFSAWRNVYLTLAGRLLAGDRDSPRGQPAAGDVALAFQTLERMRARSLLDAMDAAQATPALTGSGPTQTRRANVLTSVAVVRRRLLDPTLSDQERSAATAEFERLQREEADTRSTLATSDPVFGTLHAPKLVTFEEVDRALAPDQALLSFQLSPDAATDGTFLGGSWLIVRVPGSSRVYRLPDVSRLASEVELFLGLVARRDGSEAAGAARLYADLLGPALADLPARVTRLVIVPDWTLHSLPFDALRPQRGAAALMDRYEISLAPSATIWVRWKQRPGSGIAGQALVIADPDLSATRERPAALLRLARADAEGREVARDFGGAGELLAGVKASEFDLKHRDLSKFAVLHFATHALVDGEHPDRSALLLAPGSPAEDGWLRPREIVALHLNGQLVVLSACLSASGALVGGEGIMGLAHAFFQAGARSVIGGLWPLRDDEAADLVGAFYRHLRRGERVAEALRAARLDRARAGVPTAGWAGWTLIGDGDASAAPPASPSARSLSLYLLAIGASLVVLLGWRRRKHRAG